MSNQMDDFIARCLAGIPQGSYRTRAEKELTDHLLTLNRSLEEAGHSPEEAQGLAVSQMGDPAELARGYLREWKRRSLWKRRLTAAELVLVSPCMIAAGYLYIFNARNFGKAYPAYWGMAAIAATILLLYALFAQYRAPVRLACLILAVIQLPPIWCWMFYFGSAFEFFGVMVPGWLGLSVHALFLIWGAVSYRSLTRFQREDDLAQPLQHT